MCNTNFITSLHQNTMSLNASVQFIVCAREKFIIYMMLLTKYKKLSVECGAQYENVNRIHCDFSAAISYYYTKLTLKYCSVS